MARLCEDHSTVDVLALEVCAHDSDVVTRLSSGEGLAEGLNTRHNGVGDVLTVADKLDLVLDAEGTGLHGSSAHRALSGDVEDRLHREQERLVRGTHRGRDRRVNLGHELHHGVLPLRLTLKRTQCRPTHELSFFDVELVKLEKLLDLLLNKLCHVLSVSCVKHVHLVDEDDKGGDTDLVRQKDVLAGLGHGSVGGGDNEDGSVHLRSSSDHVLDVVLMPGAVNVCVVTVVGLVLNVGGVDGDLSSLLLGGFVNRVVALRLCQTLLRENRCDSRGQRCLSVVNVTNGTNVQMGLRLHEVLTVELHRGDAEGPAGKGCCKLVHCNVGVKNVWGGQTSLCMRECEKTVI